MNKIKYLILTVMAFMMVQTSFADDTKAYKGVKVTDKNGKVTTHFHVDSIYVFNDTVKVWNYALNMETTKVSYDVIYYKPQNIEVYDTDRGLRIFAGDEEVTKGTINVNLGQKGSVLLPVKNNYDMRWCNTYAMPYSKKLVAKDDNDNELDVEWSIDDPLIATVAPDGTIMGHTPGSTNLTATSPTGETVTVTIKTTQSSYDEAEKLKVKSFFGTEDYDRYFDHYYATDLGVWNKTKCNGFDGNYNKCDFDLNKGQGASTPDIYLGMKFDKGNTGNTDNYITNVIVVYSATEIDNEKLSEPFKIDGLTYHYASCIGGTQNNNSVSDATDLNDGVGGHCIYLAYTKDEYLRHGETEQRYLVSHSAMAFYGDDYIHDGNLSDHVNDNKNFTRLIHGGKGDVKNAINDHGAEMLNLGYDDEAVKVYQFDGTTFTEVEQLADLQYGTDEEEWISLVCTYEPYCPPAERWMGSLDDNTPVNSLSIPGTHDSSTNNISAVNSTVIAGAAAGACIVAGAVITMFCPVIGVIAFAGLTGLAAGAVILEEGNVYMGRTQRFGFKDQFRHGVRWFDIRLDASSSEGNLCHGDNFMGKTVSNYNVHSMLDELNQCLKENKSEFVILQVKVDYDGKSYNSTKLWGEINKTVGKDNLITYKKGLTLKDCRGKFLIAGMESDYCTLQENEDMNYYELSSSGCYLGDKSGKNISSLWLNDWYSLGNIKNEKMRAPSGDPAIKYNRIAHQLFNYSKLPIDRDTWLKNNISGYLVGKDGASGAALVRVGKFDSQLASYLNSRVAHYIKGMNGSPCGIVRMDFAGTNYADQDNIISGSDHIATTYGYYLCQTVIRNNIIGKEKKNGKYTLANGFTTQKDALPTRGSGPIDPKVCSNRSECGWVQLWADGPKFAEFNVGSTIGTYMGMTDYNATTVGGHYTYPKLEDQYDRYLDNASFQWGVDWRTPTPDEIKTLLSSDKTEVEYIDGVNKKYAEGCSLKGYKISGKGAYAANSIFLPAAGRDTGNDNVCGSGQIALYWGRNPKDDYKYVSEATYENDVKHITCNNTSSDYLEQGLSLRPIYEKGKGHAKFQNNRPLDGYYEIEDAYDLAAFSAFVSGDTYNGETYTPHETVKGKLMNDIDMSVFDDKNAWNSIGSVLHPFKGKFDGQYHRIKNHHGGPLFDAVGSQDGANICTIENVIIDSTCVITGTHYYVGGLAGCLIVPSNQHYTCVIIKNCGNEAEVDYKEDAAIWACVGGILGGVFIQEGETFYLNKDKTEDHADVRISNCYNTGKIHGTAKDDYQYDGILGLSSSYAHMYNCWNTGVVQRNTAWGSDIQMWAPYVNKGKYDHITSGNCYSQMPTDKPEGGNGLVDINNSEFKNIDVKSGQLCYLLNTKYKDFSNGSYAIDKPDTLVWFQKIGADHPTLYSEGNDTVYCNKVKRCDGVEYYVYKNDTIVTDSDIHSFDDNGFCKRSGTHYQPAEKNGEYYLINNAGNLYWFAQEWNAGNIQEEESQPTIMLMNHIKDNDNVLVNGQLTNMSQNLRRWTPIGTSDHPFNGSIDGRCHVISGLYCGIKDNVVFPYAGLFGKVKKISNMEGVGVVDSYFWGYQAGALAGEIEDLKVMKKCFTTGYVKTRGSSDMFYAGGLVGYIWKINKKLNTCYSLCKVDSDFPNATTHPLFGKISEGIQPTNCFHNDINYEDDGCYMDDAAFKLGLVCDKLNYEADSVFVSQRIGYHDFPCFGNAGVFYVQPANVEWSSITVPFKVKSNNYIQYYRCAGIEYIPQDGNSTPLQTWAIMEEMDEVEANTPCFMRYLKYNKETATDTDSLLITQYGYDNVKIPDGTWVIASTKDEYENGKLVYSTNNVGSIEEIKYLKTTIEASNDNNFCYFFKGGSIVYANPEDVYIPPFRSVLLFKREYNTYVKYDMRLTGFKIGKSEIQFNHTRDPYPCDGTPRYVKPNDGEKITVD